MSIDDLRRIVEPRTVDVFQRAETHSNSILDSARACLSGFLSTAGLDPKRLCFIAVGSVGRLEALEASDLDIIPVTIDNRSLKEYDRHDDQLRKALTESLKGIKVSEGRDLTKATSIVSLASPQSIGGSADNSAALTKRVLILTESQPAGGDYDINEVRRRILEAYAAGDRTRGRHALSLCNDIARYYRTLCIEYKAKVDNEDKDWCTRNLKLRHSRKFWYFACIVSIAAIAHSSPLEVSGYVERLLEAFSDCPRSRLVKAVGSECRVATGSVLERFSFFLEFMSKADHRVALAAVEHGARYAVDMNNPFPSLKANSDLLHDAMLLIVQDMAPDVRRKVFDWFLL